MGKLGLHFLYVVQAEWAVVYSVWISGKAIICDRAQRSVGAGKEPGVLERS